MNILLHECIQALQLDVEVLETETGKSGLVEFQRHFPFVGRTRSWVKIPTAVAVNSLAQLPDDILHSQCYIFWSRTGIPILRTRVDLVAVNFDDVSAVDFDKYFCALDFSWVIGVNSSGEKTYVRRESWEAAVREKQESFLALLDKRRLEYREKNGIPIEQFFAGNRRFIGHKAYLHPASIDDFQEIQATKKSFASSAVSGTFLETFSKTIFKIAAQPNRYDSLLGQPNVYRCSEMAPPTIFYEVDEVKEEVHILALLDDIWD